MFWLFGIGLAIIGTAVAFTLWEKFRDWFADLLDEFAGFIRKLGKINPRYEYYCEVTAILLEGAACKIRHKSYVEQANGNFKKTVTEATLPRDQLDPKVKAHLRRAGEEVEVTETMEMVMGRRI